MIPTPDTWSHMVDTGAVPGRMVAGVELTWEGGAARGLWPAWSRVWCARKISARRQWSSIWPTNISQRRWLIFLRPDLSNVPSATISTSSRYSHISIIIILCINNVLILGWACEALWKLSWCVQQNPQGHGLAGRQRRLVQDWSQVSPTQDRESVHCWPW